MKKRYVVLLMLGAVIGLGGILGKAFSPDRTTAHLPAASTAPVVSAPQKPEAATGTVELSGLRWKQSGFGSVAIFSFTATNKISVKIKDFKLYCEYYSKSGTRLGSNSGTIYETIDAGKSKSVKDFNMGFINNQTDDARCRIDDFVRL